MLIERYKITFHGKEITWVYAGGKNHAREVFNKHIDIDVIKE